jgi:hypothetical protein
MFSFLKRSHKSSPAGRKPACRPASFRPTFEQLENRELMAANVTANFANGLLRIQSNAAHDQLLIQNLNGQVRVEGISIQVNNQATPTIPRASLTAIEVDALGGNDYIEIYGLDNLSSVRVVGGVGNDIVLGPANTQFAGQQTADRLITGYQMQARYELLNQFRDSYGFVMQADDQGQLTGAQGEATYLTAVAAISFATDSYQQKDSTLLAQDKQAVLELLNTLTTAAWGNRDGVTGLESPIRHPDDWDYKKVEVETNPGSGSFRTEIVKDRQRPLTKDGFDQILTAVYYASHSPAWKQDPAVQSASRALVQKWYNYLVANQWSLDPRMGVPGASWAAPLGANGDPQTPVPGPESFILAPTDRYAFQSVANSLGIPTDQADADRYALQWMGLLADPLGGGSAGFAASPEVVQATADFLANAAGTGLDQILQTRILVPFTSSTVTWIDDGVRKQIVKVFEDVIRDGMRALLVGSTSPGDLLGVAVGNILGQLPSWLGKNQWSSILTTGLKEVLPWLGGDVVETATFATTLVVSDMAVARGTLGDDVIGYSVWSVAAEMEARPAMADLLRPLVKAFAADLQGHGKDGALWDWLAGNPGRVQLFLDKFQANPLHQWDDYAWQRSWNSFVQATAGTKTALSSRVDYLVLQGLQNKGAPAGLTGVVLSWRDDLVNAIKSLKPQDFVALFKGLGVSWQDIINSAVGAGFVSNNSFEVAKFLLNTVKTSLGDAANAISGWLGGNQPAAFWAIVTGAGRGLADGVRAIVGAGFVANDSFKVATYLLNTVKTSLGDAANAISGWLGGNRTAAFWAIASGASRGYADGIRGLLQAGMLGNDLTDIYNFLISVLNTNDTLSTLKQLGFSVSAPGGTISIPGVTINISTSGGSVQVGGYKVSW